MVHDVTDRSGLVGAGGAFGGVLGMYLALGLGLGILAFAAAMAAPPEVAEGGEAAAEDVAAGATALLVGVLPILAAPFVALGAGAWCGHSSRDAGVGLGAGALGCVLGTLVTFAIVGIAFALGATAGGVDPANVNFEVGVSPQLANFLQFVASVAGLLYLLAIAVIGGVAGLVVGAVMPKAHVVYDDVGYRRPIV